MTVPSLAYRISQRVLAQTVRAVPETVCRCVEPIGLKNRATRDYVIVCQRCLLVLPAEKST